jgi:hypothetical protein
VQELMASTSRIRRMKVQPSFYRAREGIYHLDFMIIIFQIAVAWMFFTNYLVFCFLQTRLRYACAKLIQNGYDDSRCGISSW